MRVKLNTMGATIIASLLVGHFFSLLWVLVLAILIGVSMYFVGNRDKRVA